jgi:hypothetical protein
MPYLWIQYCEKGWSAEPLEGRLAIAPGVEIYPLTLRPDSWAVLSSPRSPLRLNGSRLHLGLSVLVDRDELRIPDARLFYTDDCLARMETLSAHTAKGYCARCRQRFEEGQLAVCCPGCGLWHHATDVLPCWSYADTCAGCDRRTSQDAGFRWTPEEL